MSVSPSTPPLPSTRRLVMATGIAAIVATLVLLTTVLPAEYGIDPTGIGTRLGLTALSTPADDGAAKAAPDTAAVDPSTNLSGAAPLAPIGDTRVLSKHASDVRRETQSITLAPGEGTERKARMKAGDTFVFHWTADAALSVDMHGERVDAKEGEFTSYWLEDDQSKASGAFTAPFDGSHGWYWENQGNTPVTIRLELSGFQQELFSP